MKTADLRLMLMRHEKAQANMHCSGGALVCIKRIQRRIALEPTMPSGIAMRKLEPPPELPAAGGTLTKEMRSFVRGVFGPMIRAGASRCGARAGCGLRVCGKRPLLATHASLTTPDSACFPSPGLRQLLLQQPPDPFTFLADFFWQHSSSRRTALTSGELDATPVTTARLQTLDAAACPLPRARCREPCLLRPAPWL